MASRDMSGILNPKKVNNMKYLPLLPLLAIGACASIVNGTQQSLSVKTSPVDAQCTLKNSKGTWFVETPGSVTVQRSYGNLHVSCHKDDKLYGSQDVKSTTKPIAFGNVLFGGVIGAGVDIGNGAAYDYPNLIEVHMKPKGW